MSKSFAIAMSICLLIQSLCFLVVGYQWWLSIAFVVGVISGWTAILSLLKAWKPELNTTRSVLGWLTHCIALFCSVAGIVFVLPEPAVEEAMLLWFALLSVVSLVFTGSFLGFAEQKQETSIQPFLRFILWAIIWFIIVLSLMVWTEFIWDVNTSLVFCFLLAVFGLEGVWKGSKTLRKLWNKEQVEAETLLRNTSLELLCSRVNPVSSIFDRLERFFGIDIKGTWAIHFIRKALEPLCVAIVVLSWIASSLVLIDTHEKGVREHFGIAETQVLGPGLHVKLPWPLGAINKVPAHRILQMSIGHEESDSPEEEEEGPESILWANQHADEEFTLLLGDGHDLISADGILHYQITDVHDFLYATQNPEDILRSITYRVLMHETASRTLDEALNENLNELAGKVTERITAEVAQEKIGIEPVIFSFSALHPPVSVALDYQQVISAQIDRDTKIIRAETHHRQSLRKVELLQYSEQVKANQSALERVSAAVGEARTFEGLRQSVRQDEALYLFRRRQEALEKNLQGRDLLIIDHRLEKQGAQLWIQE